MDTDYSLIVCTPTLFAAVSQCDPDGSKALYEKAAVSLGKSVSWPVIGCMWGIAMPLLLHAGSS